jgi:hypothetical protein
LKEFKYGSHSGRWGELVAIKGPRVGKAEIVKGGASGGIELDHGTLQLTTSGDGNNMEVKRFTSMERFRGDANPKTFFVQLPPQPQPYGAVYEPHNDVVKTLRAGHDGRCFHIYGGHNDQERAILIHEAPNVTWLTGCISPRPLHNFTVEFENAAGNPSYNAMNELFQFVGADRADFFVLDW